MIYTSDLSHTAEDHPPSAALGRTRHAVASRQPGADEAAVRSGDRAAAGVVRDLGFRRIVASEIEAPNMLAILV